MSTFKERMKNKPMPKTEKYYVEDVLIAAIRYVLQYGFVSKLVAINTNGISTANRVTKRVQSVIPIVSTLNEKTKVTEIVSWVDDQLAKFGTDELSEFETIMYKLSKKERILMSEIPKLIPILDVFMREGGNLVGRSIKIVDEWIGVPKKRDEFFVKLLSRNQRESRTDGRTFFIYKVVTREGKLGMFFSSSSFADIIVGNCFLMRATPEHNTNNSSKIETKFSRVKIIQNYGSA